MHVCPTRKVRALSRGEKQRVTIARAVLLKPGIILATSPRQA
ncbi:MAG: ATP-binding cassette domain-containing protein [Bilophila wadsworthia]